MKRFSRNNATIALGKGKHPVKIIYLNNIIGSLPQVWNRPNVSLKKVGEDKFIKVKSEMYSY